MLGPTYPSTTGAQAPSLGTHITECVQLALSQIVPEDTSAIWSRHLCPIVTGKRRDKTDPRTGTPYIYWASPFHADGSSGALKGFDGVDGIGPIHTGGAVVRAPVEVEEWDTPYRWLHYEFSPDSAGDGEWRGGPRPPAGDQSLRTGTLPAVAKCWVSAQHSGSRRMAPLMALIVASSGRLMLWTSAACLEIRFMSSVSLWDLAL